MENVFFEIGIIIIVATLMGLLARLLKQPLIPAYVFAGLLIGPFGIGLITDLDIIRTLSEIGIAFLLFVVGLELDLRKLKDVGIVASLGGTIQVMFLFMAGFLIASLFGIFTTTETIYIGFMIAFSSTMVVVKILSDKKELDTLHGRIIIGILLMEDILAILGMSMISSLDNISPAVLFIAVLKGIALFAITAFASSYIFPVIFKKAARNQEILFLVSITVCFLFSFLAVYLGFSIIVGSFIAGIALANLPYNLEIIGRVKPLRDFFATVFFVTLGMGLVIGSITKMIVPIIVLTLVVLFFKPFLIMLIGSLFGYTKRTTFLTGITLAQISEFSLIIIAAGAILGHISPDVSTMAVVIAITTLITTSYLIQYNTWVYHKIQRLLSPFDRLSKKKKEPEYMPEKKEYDVILIGYNRIGYVVLQTLRKLKKSVLVVDFNPDIIKRMVREKVPCIYGDIGDIEIIERLNMKDADIVISTVPEKTDNLLLIKKLKAVNHKASIFATSATIDTALELYDAGADYVILPHLLGGDHVSIMLEDITGNINKLLETKLKHIENLKSRKGLGHEHKYKPFGAGLFHHR